MERRSTDGIFCNIQSKGSKGRARRGDGRGMISEAKVIKKTDVEESQDTHHGVTVERERDS